jgi:integrase
MLTTKKIENLKPDPKRRLEIADGRSLFLQLNPSGAASWACRYRAGAGGKVKKLTLGRWPAVSLKEARTLATKARAAVNEGRDPQAEKKEARRVARLPADDGDLVEKVIALFLKEHVKPNLRPRTVAEITRIMLNRVLPAWRGRKIVEITRRDIKALAADIAVTRGPVAGNTALSWIKRFFSFAIEEDILDKSPVVGIKAPAPAAKKPRQRVLNHDEIRALWLVCDELDPPAGNFVRLLLLTGVRRSEAANLPWAELDLDNREWKLPGARAKNKADFVIPLSDMAMDLLRSIERRGPYVFTLNGTGPIRDFSGIKNQLAARLPPGTPDWRFHDLRRTAGTEWNRLRIDLEVREAMLNHAKDILNKTYNVYDLFDEKRAGFAKWARKLGEIVNGIDAPNVVPLRTA